MNYAYRGSSSPINMQPFTSFATGLPFFSQGFYNDNPDLAWEELIRRSRPSLTNTDLLRRMFNSIRDQWTSQQWNDQIAGNPMTSFTDYIRNYNFGREFANTTPAIRRENPSYFNRPVRVIPF